MTAVPYLDGCHVPLSGDDLEREWAKMNRHSHAYAAPVDPLHVTYDGVMLRTLLDGDEFNRREYGNEHWRVAALTPAQRAAISAHWSAELRLKIKAAAEAVRQQVKVAVDDLD